MSLITEEEKLGQKEKSRIATKLLCYLRVIYRKLSKSKPKVVEPPNILINFIYKSLYNFRAANYMRFSSIEVIKQNVLVNKIFETPQAKLMSITELKELAESKIINSF